LRTWDSVKSTNKELIWEGAPPIDYVIKPYNHKEINDWVKKYKKKDKL